MTDLSRRGLFAGALGLGVAAIAAPALAAPLENLCLEVPVVGDVEVWFFDIEAIPPMMMGYTRAGDLVKRLLPLPDARDLDRILFYDGPDLRGIFDRPRAFAGLIDQGDTTRDRSIRYRFGS